MCLRRFLLLAAAVVPIPTGDTVFSQESPQQATPDTASYEKIAPLLEGMGDHHHTISTDNKLAQRSFDQGLFQIKIPVAYALTAIPARLAFERQDWKRAAALDARQPASFEWDKFRATEAITHFARALGAAHLGDAEAAREAIGKLETLHDKAAETSAYWAKQIKIQKLAAEAWFALMQDNRDEALRTMREAAELEASTEKHPVRRGMEAADPPKSKRWTRSHLHLGNDNCFLAGGPLC